MIFIFTKYIWR